MKIITIQSKCVLVLVVLALGLILGFDAIAYADSKPTPTMAETKDGNYYYVNFPPGTIFRGLLQSGISSVSSNVGDEFDLIIPADIQIGEVVCIPQDSKFIGSIVRMGRAQAGKNGFMQISIESLKLPDGQEISILGHLWTKNALSTIGGELTEREGYRKMQQSIEGVGDVAQLIPYGPRVMGKDTEVLPGSEWVLVLDRNLKVLVEKGD